MASLSLLHSMGFNLSHPGSEWPVNSSKKKQQLCVLIIFGQFFNNIIFFLKLNFPLEKRGIRSMYSVFLG